MARLSVLNARTRQCVPSPSCEPHQENGPSLPVTRMGGASASARWVSSAIATRSLSRHTSCTVGLVIRPYTKPETPVARNSAPEPRLRTLGMQDRVSQTEQRRDRALPLRIPAQIRGAGLPSHGLKNAFARCRRCSNTGHALAHVMLLHHRSCPHQLDRHHPGGGCSSLLVCGAPTPLRAPLRRPSPPLPRDRPTTPRTNIRRQLPNVSTKLSHGPERRLPY
jgi:hypothetical protein